MADIAISMAEATERAATYMSVVVTDSKPTPDEEMSVVPYNIWSIGTYAVVQGMVVGDTDLPETLSISVNPEHTGSQMVRRRTPWRPAEYRYLVDKPSIRWVPDKESMFLAAPPVIEKWFATVPSGQTVLRSTRNSCIWLPGLDTTAPQFLYTAKSGWVACDAVSIGRGDSMTYPLGTIVAQAHIAMVIGSFPKPTNAPYECIVMESGGVRVSAAMDIAGQLLLTLGGETIAAVPMTRVQGALAGVMIGLGAGTAHVVVADTSRGRAAASAPVSATLPESVSSIIMSSPSTADMLVVDASYWARNSGDPGMDSAVLQMLAALSYYLNRSEE